MRIFLLALMPLALTGCLLPGAARLFPENKDIHADEATLTTPYGTMTMKNVSSTVSGKFKGWPAGQTNVIVVTNYISVKQESFKLHTNDYPEESDRRIHPTPRSEPEN